MKRLLWLLESVLFIFLSLPFAILPYRASLNVGALLGTLLFYAWGSRRKIAVENIEKSVRLGAIKINTSPGEIAKESFMNFGRSFVEVIKIYYRLADKIIADIEIIGEENYQKARAKNKGVIFISGHCGNWELLATAFGVRINPAAGVARAQNNPYLNRLLEKARYRYGNRIIYKKGALKGILSELKNDRTVSILMDQAVIKEEGFIIDFLGRGAWTTKMPALLARKTGAPVLSAFIHRSNGRHVITINPEVELSREEDAEKAVIEDTKKFTGLIEDYIKQHPTEWLWIHRRWKRVD